MTHIYIFPLFLSYIFVLPSPPYCAKVATTRNIYDLNKVRIKWRPFSDWKPLDSLPSSVACCLIRFIKKREGGLQTYSFYEAVTLAALQSYEPFLAGYYDGLKRQNLSAITHIFRSSCLFSLKMERLLYLKERGFLLFCFSLYKRS